MFLLIILYIIHKSVDLIHGIMAINHFWYDSSAIIEKTYTLSSIPSKIILLSINYNKQLLG